MAAARQQRRWRLTAVAAALALVASGAWFFGDWSQPAPGPRPGDLQTAELRAEVDLREYTVERSDRPRVERRPVVLSRGRVTMTILLPIGFEPGQYELQVLDSELRSRAAASGPGEIRDFTTTINATMDLSAVPAGSYQLAIRREDEDWHLFPAVVK